MRNTLSAAWCAMIGAVALSAPCRCGEPSGEKAALPPAKMEYKWFFCFGHRRSRENAAKVKALVDTAAEHGLNDMVLSSFGLDSITRWHEKDLALLKEVAEHCRRRKVELIPTGFSAGYGGGALGHDRNFAAALPAEVSLVARGGKAVPVPGPNLLTNGGLEEHKNGRFTGYEFHDAPGKVTFVDSDVASFGKTSIRFEMAAANQHGHGRIMQKATLKPGRAYRLTCRVRTRELRPASGFKVMVLAEKGSLATLDPGLKPTTEWTTVTLDFINRKETEIRKSFSA